MLASAVEPLELEQMQFPMYASPKLDGIRVLIRGGRVLTRSLKELPNEYVQRVLGKAALNGLDGEIMVGEPTSETVFRETTSAVMSRAGEPDFTFWVFDTIYGEGGFQKRFAELQNYVQEVQKATGRVKLVPHRLLHSYEEVMAFEEYCVLLGYEGIMLRSVDGPYKHGRATLKQGWLLKLKRFRDDEAIVVGSVERMHNANVATVNELGLTERSVHKDNMVGRGDLGALWAMMPKPGKALQDVKNILPDVERMLPKLAVSQAALKKFNESNPFGWLFTIGTGLNDEQRKEMWQTREQLVGKTTTFKHMDYGGFDGPRFPVFKGFRDEADLS